MWCCMVCLGASMRWAAGNGANDWMGFELSEGLVLVGGGRAASGVHHCRRLDSKGVYLFVSGAAARCCAHHAASQPML